MSRADCDQCDEEFAKLHEQIATLKAALIDRDLRLLEPCNGECNVNYRALKDAACDYDNGVSHLAG
jgi:hypothetical protein